MAAADNHDMQTFQARQSYDYRIREAICETGDRDLFPELNIPRSTIRSWARRGVPDVVTCDLALGDRSDLVVEIRELRHRTAFLGAVIGLLIAMLRVSKISLNHERLPEGASKRVLLRAGRKGLAAERGAPKRAYLVFALPQLDPCRGWVRAG